MAVALTAVVRLVLSISHGRPTLLALLVTATLACAPPPSRDEGTTGGNGSPPCSGASPSYAASVAPIVGSCGGSENCHRPYDYAGLVNRSPVFEGCNPGALLVKPGDPTRSYLVSKLTGVGMCPHTDRMPLFGAALPASQIQTIVDWICAGASNN
jgi:hypothetical protein